MLKKKTLKKGISYSPTNLPYYSAKNLSQSSENLVHSFFTRQGGVSNEEFFSLNTNPHSNDLEENIRRNRKLTIQSMGDYQLYTLNQVHGKNVIILDKENAWQGLMGPEGDAIITSMPNTLIGVQTADCVPILLYLPTQHVAAAIHAGWRGAIAGVIESTILALITHYNAIPEHIIAAIGPSIQSSSYEIGDEVFYAFLERDPNNAQFFSKQNGNVTLDVPGYCEQVLKNQGVKNIENLSVDTYANSELFFSYRRQTHEYKKAGRDMIRGVCGAQLSIIGLK